MAPSRQTVRKRLPKEWILVVALALCVKFVYLHERVALPDLASPTMDSLFHHEWAMGLAFDQWTPDLEKIKGEPYFRAPLYPYFVAAVYRAFSTDPTVLLTIQVCLGAISVCLMYGLALLLFGRAAARIAALLQLGYWPLTYYEAERLIPAVSIPLDIASLVLLIVAGRQRNPWLSIAAGAVLGLAAVARPTILVVAPVAAAFLIWQLRPNGLRHGLLLACGVFLMILPVTVRNAVVGHDFVPIASQGGVNFYIGNNPKSDGVRAVVPGTRADWWGGFYDTRRIAEESLGRPLRASEVSGYWYGRGREFWRDEPARAVRLLFRKAALVLGNGEVSNERQLYFARRESDVLRLLPFNFALILALALVGFTFVLRSRHDAGPLRSRERVLPYVLALVCGAVTVAFFVTSRYRIPVVLFLLPGAAYGATRIWDSLRSKNWTTLRTGLMIGVPVFVLSSLNPFAVGALSDSRGRYNLATDYLRQGRDADAMREFSASIEADSGYAPAWNGRGVIHERLRDLDAAMRDYEVATRLDSTLANAAFRLGVVYQKTGRHAEAEKVYVRALRYEPERVEALVNLADVCFRQGRASDAATYLQRALELDPDFPNAIYGWGYYLELQGNVDEAIAHYERIRSYGPARRRLEALRQEGY